MTHPVKLELKRKPNGQHFRITVQHQPVELTSVLKLQSSLSNTLPDFIAKDPPYIHLTLLHLGIPQDLYFEVRKVVSGLRYEHFESMYMEFLKQLYTFTSTGKGEIELNAVELNYYGSIKSPAVAVTIQRNAELDGMHLDAFEIMIAFLQELTIPNPLEFIQASRNLRHSPPEVFNPHITLGRVSAKTSQLPLLPSPIRITIGQPYLAHVTVV